MFTVLDNASIIAIHLRAVVARHVPSVEGHYLKVLRYIGERMLRTLANTYHDLPPALR